jgi:hypothetical protein
MISQKKDVVIALSDPEGSGLYNKVWRWMNGLSAAMQTTNIITAGQAWGHV